MARWQLIALLLGVLLFTAPLVRADEYEDDDEEPDTAADESKDDVLVLTNSNFEKKIKNSKFALVEFYAPWCGHCKKLEPEYTKAAAIVKKYDPAIILGKVDATVEKDLGGKFKVSGYPTLKWFVNGELASDYNGPRDANGIASWIKKKTGPASTPLAAKDELSKAEADNEVLLLGFFDKLEGAEYDAFIKFAQKTDDAGAFHTTAAEVAAAAGLDLAPGIAVITNFKGEKRVVAPLQGAPSDKSLTELLNSEKLPPTIEFNDNNSKKIFGSGIQKQLLLVAPAADLAADAAVYKAYRAVALALRGQLVFVTVDVDGTSKTPVMNFFGIKDKETPVVVGFEASKNKKFRMAEELSEESIRKFGEELLAGTVKAVLKSAPVPAEPTEGGVTVVVGKNFDTIVKDPTKDVLLEVYAPWCGHCKQLEPVYKELAKSFSKVDSVVIAKMDGTDNEHPDVEVKGFPTILFFPAGDAKKSIAFAGGDRSLESLTKFIKTHAKTSLEESKGPEAAEEDAGESSADADADDKAGTQKDEL